MIVTIATPRDNDVILSPGIHSNTGNIICSNFISQTLDAFYSPVVTSEDRHRILSTIYEGIQQMGGRFVYYCNYNNSTNNTNNATGEVDITWKFHVTKPFNTWH